MRSNEQEKLQYIMKSEKADVINDICSFAKEPKNVNNAEWVSCIIRCLVYRM